MRHLQPNGRWHTPDAIAKSACAARVYGSWLARTTEEQGGSGAATGVERRLSNTTAVGTGTCTQ